MILDIAHLNGASTKAVLKTWKGPLMVSHTALFSLNPHPQNVSDNLVKSIINRNGIIGFAFLDKFYSPVNATMADVVAHLTYFRRKFGSYNCAFGSDFYGFGSSNSITGLENMGLLPNLAKELKKNGWNAAEVDRLLWKNAYQFLIQSLGV